MDEKEKAAEMKQQLLETLSDLRWQMDNLEFCANLRSKDVADGEMLTENALGWVEDAVKQLEAIARKERKKLHALAEKLGDID